MCKIETEEYLKEKKKVHVHIDKVGVGFRKKQ